MPCRDTVFTGVCTALVTPFTDSGGLNTAKFADLIDEQLSAGVPALCICGTTGEASTLRPEEKLEAIAFCCRYTAGRAKILAGTGGNDTAEVLRLSRGARDAGADGLLIVTPYYNKTTQAGLVKHYVTVADAVELPILLYNVPSRTGLSFTPETYRILSEHPNIVGVKEASGDLSLFSRTRLLCGDGFQIWSGNDDQVVPMMALGAAGVISVAGNLIPAQMVRLTELCRTGHYPEAAALQLRLLPLLRALFSEVNPIPIKTAMALTGHGTGPVRLPLCELSPEHLQALKEQLQAFSLL